MKVKYIITAVAAAVSCVAMAQAPAFPGAEGHGRYVTGGRGGKVVHVTNLNDSGDGSLRAAVSGSEKKIVVFDVAGVIPLKSDLKIGANTTIEGQTAPSPGITVRYYTVRPDANNVIIRFIRFRRGQEKDVNDGADAIWTRHQKGMILDHCSISWSIDELASFYDNNNFTMQWCMLGEALANAGHGKGAHSYGGIWGGKLASFHHNYLGFMQNRVPRFCGARYNWTGYKQNDDFSKYNWQNAVQAENVDFRNCVMYNWGNGNGCYGGPGGGFINIVNNYYKAGPGTTNKTRVTEVTVANSSNSSGNSWCFGLASRYYINGNYVTAAEEGKRANFDWKGVYVNGDKYTVDGEVCFQDSDHYYGPNAPYKTYTKMVLTKVGQKGRTPIYDTTYVSFDVLPVKSDTELAPHGEVTTQSAETAYSKVLAYSGASLYRDAVDARFVSNTEAGTTSYTGSNGTKTAGIIDFVADDADSYTENTPGWGLTKSTLVDTDGDGMPDDFETANGLDPNDPSDATAYTIDDPAKGGKGWYTNIEVYCNSLVESIMKAGNADAVSAVDEYYPKVNVTNGIQQSFTDDAPVSVRYYLLDGTEVRNIDAVHGVLLRVETLKNGKHVARKVMR